MRLLGLVLAVSLAAALFAGCGNSVDAVNDPTPTPTEETPTPTPTPGGLTGTYSVTAAQPVQICAGNDVDGDGNNDNVQLTFNVPTVYIAVDGGDFTPDWNFSTNANFSVPDPEHGTITGNNWTAYYTYCDYSAAVNKTTKHVVTWTGTFNGDGTFDSTLTQKLRNATGNQTANCGATETGGNVTTDMLSCTSPGISWSIHGVQN
jgi:hypothetical protein